MTPLASYAVLASLTVAAAAPPAATVGPTCQEASQALAAPADRVGRAASYVALGVCAAEDDADAALDAFRRALAVDPQATLPSGVPAQAASIFSVAKAEVTAAPPLALVVQSDATEDGVRTVRFALRDDLELVRAVTWRSLTGGASGGPVRAAPLFELELPAGSDVLLVALDANGGEMLTLELPVKRKAARVDLEDAPPAAAPTPVSPWLVAGAVAGGAVVLGALGVGAWLLFAPPPTATLKTDVAFAE
jgi:hypothetical protein